MSKSQEVKDKIKNSLTATRLKRKSQICKVIDLKIDSKRLNKSTLNSLNMYFLESKWLYNYILNSENPYGFNYQTNEIKKMNKDKEFETVTLQHLPQRFKQTLVTVLHQNIHSLSSLKKKGKKVGKLKFKSDYNSIEMNENGVTHKIVNGKIKILGIKKHLKVFGLNQITEDMEFANAKLVKLPDGFHIKLTTYSFPKGEIKQEQKTDVGLDFGISRNITTSDGEFFNVCIEETEHLKRLQQKLSRSKKGSNNRYKTILLIRKEYLKMNNKKKDKANKIVNYLLKKYNQVIIQDENLKGWKSGRYGKQVQHSVMGTVKSKLRESSQTIMINRFLPTTKMCYICGHTKDFNDLSERTFICEKCGHSEDRDIKAAKTILKLGLIT